MTVRVSKVEVIAFRLHAHYLRERVDGADLLDAAGRCGIQNSPPGSALLALHARVRDLTRKQVENAVDEEKSLLQTWCMRGAPFFFPTKDAPVFTAGVLPPTEEAMRHLILGVEQSLDRLSISLTEAVQLVGVEMDEVLSGRQLPINELGAEVAKQIADKLPVKQRHLWVQEGPYAAGQSIGEAVVHFCLRILTLKGVVCFAKRTVNKAPFVLVDEGARPADPPHRPRPRARRVSPPLPALLWALDPRGLRRVGGNPCQRR